MANSSIYIEPTASTTLSTARINQNNTFRSLLTNFNSADTPTSTNLTVSGTTLAIPDGMLFRHTTNGALYIADSVNKLGSPVGGNFTRVGIGARVEATTASLNSNAGTYEKGELVVTLDAADEKLFLCTATTPTALSDFMDLSTPASYSTDAYGNVTITASQVTVSQLLVEDITINSSSSTILQSDTDDNLTAGFTSSAVNDGTKSSGTYTPTPTGGNIRTAINNGAFQLNPPSTTGSYTMVIQLTNGATPGTVTIGSFTRTTGDSLSTTASDVFLLYITKVSTTTTLHIVALQ